MHYVAHVIHPAGVTDDYFNQVMAPYYEELEVDEYKVYYSEKDIASAKEWYKKEHKIDIDLIPDDWNGHPSYVDEDGQYYITTSNPQGHWDWWVIGGRWENYYSDSFSLPAIDSGPVCTVSVKSALEFLNSQTDSYKAEGPYTYVTLEGAWVSKILYNPDGEGYADNDPNSVFPPNEDYMYREYLEHVQSIPDLMVTVIDYHC